MPNEYSDIVAGMKRDHLRASIALASRGQPDTEAKLQALSARTGLPVEAIRLNQHDVEYRDRLNSFDYERVLRESPALASWAADPANAAVASDDWDSLSAAEKLFTHALDIPRAFGEGVVGTGAGSTLSGFGELFGVATRSIRRGMTAISPELGNFGRPETLPAWTRFLDPGYMLRSQGTALKQAGEAIGPPKERENLATDVAAGVGQLGFQIAAALTTGGAASTTMMVGQGADIMAEKTARDQADPAMRDIAIVAGGGITALTERFGLEKILNRVPPEIRNRTMRFIADKVTAGGIEAAQEFTEGLLHDVSRYVLTNRDAPILEGVTREMSAAGLSAAIVRTALGVRGYTRAKQTEEFFKALGDNAQASKLRERLPDRYKALIDRYTKDGPLKTVYVPADRFAEYFQSQDMNPAQIAEQVGAANYHEALATGGDIAIPMGEFAAKLAPTDHLQGLLQDLRLREDEMTSREADEFEKQRGEFEKEAAKVKPEAPGYAEIREAAMGELVGRFEPSTAESYADYTARAFVTLAQRSGEDPVALYRRWGPRIVSPLPDVLTRMPSVDITIDPLLDRIRSGDVPRQREVFGESLVEWIRRNGGVQDEGGELSAMDAELWDRQNRRVGEGRLVNPNGVPMDEVRQRAQLEGYPIGERMDDLVAAIDRELRGEPVYVYGAGENRAGDIVREVEQLEQLLNELGLDVQTMTNDQIRARLQEVRQYDQRFSVKVAGQMGQGEVLNAGGENIPLNVSNIFGRVKKPSFLTSAEAEAFKGDWDSATLSRLEAQRDKLQADIDALSGDEVSAKRNAKAIVQKQVELQDAQRVVNGYIAIRDQQLAEWSALRVQEIVAERGKVREAYLAWQQQQPAQWQPSESESEKAARENYERVKKAEEEFAVSELMRREGRSPTQIKSATGNRGTFDPNDPNILFQSESKPLIGEGEGKRVLQREPGNLLPEEQAAFDAFLATREDADLIRANLERHKGTPWAKQAVEGILVRQGMRMLLEGKDVPYQSSLNSSQVSRTARTLRERGVDGLWALLEADGGMIGAAAKPVNNVNSSFINCNPTPDCAKYCYATTGNYRYAGVVVKSELVTLAVELDPVRAAKRVANEYKATAEFANNKALRLFDKGDGNAAWLPFIRELNKQGVRVQVFSKVPEFLRAVPSMNLRLLSIDDSNMDMADANPDLPVAFVYTGKAQVDFLAKLAARNQVQVVLPVKLGRNLLDGSEVSELKQAVPAVKPYLCPIDAGFKKLGKTSQPGTWNCTKCDVNGGVGCFHGNATKAIMASLEVKPSTPQARAQRILELREQINAITSGSAGTLEQAGRIPPGGVEGLLRQVDSLLGELLRDYDGGAEAAAAAAAGSGTGPQGGGAQGSVSGRIPVKQLFQSDAESAGGSDTSVRLDDKRGYIRFGEAQVEIGLLEKANLSTFLHETGHLWLEIIRDLSTRPGATEQMRADGQTLLDWFGVASWDDVGVDQHEKFARGNEAYLREGKAPSPALRGVFQRFSAWLSLIYRAVSQLNVELTDEVRGVFDRIYASDTEIEAARAEMEPQALFLTAADAGMTEIEFAAYQETVRQQTEAAKDELQTKLMREFQRAQERWWKDRRAEMRASVAAEVAEQRGYRALDILVAGNLPDGTAIKLDRNNLVSRYGEAFVVKLPRGMSRVYSAQGGIDADTAAEMLGFRDGPELIEALANLRPRQQLIEAETDRRMTEQYGDMLRDGRIAEEAREALHNDYREKVLRMELRALRAKVRDAQPGIRAERAKAAEQRRRARAATDTPSAQAFRAMARGIIAQKQVRDVQPNSYLLAERRASKAAFDAMSKGDFEVAAIEKQRELLNHYLYLEATKAKQEAESIVGYLTKFTKDKKRAELGKAGGSYLDQIDALLERYEFKKVTDKQLRRREALAAWVAAQEAEGNAVSVPEELLDDSRRLNWRQVSIDELRALRDAVHNIAHLANLKNKLIRKGKLIEFGTVRTELLDSMDAAGFASTGDLGRPNWTSATITERAAGAWRRFDAEHMKVEQIVEWLDGGKIDGPWARYFFDLADDAQSREFDLHQQVTQRVQAASEAVSKEWRASLLDRTTVRMPGFAQPLTRYDLISIAMNMGNAQNLQRLRDGYNWSDADLQRVRDALTVEDMTFVQSVWDALEVLWPDMAAMEKRLSGLEPEKVEAVELEVAGQTWRGGYFPLAYDPKRSRAGEKQADETQTVGQFMAAGMGRAATNKGATKKRVEKLDYAPLLDYEQVITSHLAKVIKDISHREAVIGLNKILLDDEIKAALIDKLGDARYREMRNWLQVLVSDRADTLHQAKGVGRLIMKARTNMAIVTIGWKICSMLAQFAGFGPSADLVKPSFLAKAMIQTMRSPAETWEQVQVKSGEMRNRAGTLDRDVKDALLRMRGEGGVAADVRRTAFYLTAMADRVVSVPTWWGAYQQALAEGKGEEDAVRAGDRAVRLSQGAGGAKDLTAVQRNNELMRLLTMYYTPFAALYARLRDVGHRLGQDGVSYLPAAAARLLALVMLPAVLGEMLAARGPDEDEDPVWWAVRKMLLYPVATIPVVRDFAGYLEAGMIDVAGEGEMQFAPEYRLTPVLGAMQKLARVPGRVVEAAGGERPVDDVFWDVVEASGYIWGLPTGQVRITGEYLEDLMTGDADPENASEVMRDVLFRREK